MSVVHSTCFIAEGIDFAAINRENIRSAFVIGLPFRLRIGSFYRQRFTLHGHHFEVALRNKVSVPMGTALKDLLPSIDRSVNEVWTDTVVVIEDPKIEENTINALRAWKPSSGEDPPIKISRNIFDAQEALNHFIVAYATATNLIWGGRPLRLFRHQDFFDALRWEVPIFCLANESLSDENYMQLLDLRPDREIRSITQLTGHVDDLPSEMLPGIGSSLVRQTEFIHYELAFEAKSKMLAEDYVGALFMAVVALEAAHGAFVQHELAARLHSQSSKSLPDDFLRELGISLCMQLTPFLLMDATERPSSKLIRECGKGITLRNHIAHGKKKKGKYRLRTVTTEELSTGYSAVLDMYKCYVMAIEQRLKRTAASTSE